MSKNSTTNSMSPELGNKLRFTFKTITLVLMLIAIPVIAFIVGIMAVQVSTTTSSIALPGSFDWSTIDWTSVHTTITETDWESLIGADALNTINDALAPYIEFSKRVTDVTFESANSVIFTYNEGGYVDQPWGLILGGFIPFIILTLVSGSLWFYFSKWTVEN